jgi:hypothetical protein
MTKNELILGKYSFGVGDRFAHQAKAQLQAIQKAGDAGVNLTPVWNKSYREHQIIGSEAKETRIQADAAINAFQWTDPYFLDADHINLNTVDFFMDSCDFFTLDVADYIGRETDNDAKDKFINLCKNNSGRITLPIINMQIEIDEAAIKNVADKYLYAVQEASKIYQHILNKKVGKPFVVEVSMDETEESQTPVELFLILSALADAKVPVQTIAPKFSGRFNKGVDYVGDLALFKSEFEQDVAVINLAVSEFGLPKSLKLSIHSGSDKFSIYPIIREAIRKLDAGLHIKTAGTTWLEELIGLAEAGGTGLEMAKKIYRESLDHFDELCAPYATVIDINHEELPSAAVVDNWDGPTYAATLRHDQSNPGYNSHVRQLLHVGYKIAANMGEEYLKALDDNESIIAENVTENIFERHIKPLFF